MQETALNHVKTVGLLGDGFGSTPEMSKRNLFWVVSQMQAIVERYPCWYDLQNHLFFLLWSRNHKFVLEINYALLFYRHVIIIFIYVYTGL
jgi:hypothetical protein